jgi:ATP-dependent DNA ligase
MITPVVARLEPFPFDREGWLSELKWDGFRAITEIDEARLPIRLSGRIVV